MRQSEPASQHGGVEFFGGRVEYTTLVSVSESVGPKKQKAKVKVVYVRTLVEVRSGMNQPKHVCSRLDS